MQMRWRTELLDPAGGAYSAPQIFYLDLVAGVRKGIKDGRTGVEE